jgi:hypothetical protein
VFLQSLRKQPETWINSLQWFIQHIVAWVVCMVPYNEWHYVQTQFYILSNHVFTKSALSTYYNIKVSQSACIETRLRVGWSLNWVSIPGRGKRFCSLPLFMGPSSLLSVGYRVLLLRNWSFRMRGAISAPLIHPHGCGSEVTTRTVYGRVVNEECSHVCGM